MAGETPTTERSCARGVCAQFAGELEHQVAAHGVADQRDAFEALALEEEAHDGVDIAGEPGVVERGRERAIS